MDPGVAAPGAPAAHGVGSDRRFGIPEAAEEYDCMSSPLLHRQFEDMGTRSLARLISHERSSHFVLEPDDTSDTQLAEQFTTWQEA